MLYLGSELQLASKLATQQPTKHLPPFCCLGTWVLPSQFISKVRFGVLQYVLCKSLTSVAAFVLESRGVHTYIHI